MNTHRYKFCFHRKSELVPGAITLPLILLVGAATGQAASPQDPPMSHAAGRPDTTPARLPWARGHSFATLDAYLAYLEQSNGPIDLPWWREVQPGVYEKMVRMPEVPRETATRAELERRWGFAPAR